MTVTSPKLNEHWKALISRIDQQMEVYLNLGEDCPSSHQEAMSYSLFAGGKRLRPVLVLLACEASGGNSDNAMPAACAIEMVHTYSLIHDDLPAMDDDDLRRGKPTCHIQFGEANAILAGDGLLTLAFEIISANVKPAESGLKCCFELAKSAGSTGMVAGQVADLEAEKTGISTLEDLQAIHKRKTGRLITCAVQMGGIIAGAESQTIQRLITYGEAIGLAFQITDDILDVVGDQKKMGKGVQKDAEHGKLTYPGFQGVEKSLKQAEDLISQACEAVSPLGEKAAHLTSLANFILNRDH